MYVQKILKFYSLFLSQVFVRLFSFLVEEIFNEESTISARLYILCD